MKLKFTISLFLIFFQFKNFAQMSGASPYCTPAYTSSYCTQPAAPNTPGNFVNDFIQSFYTTGADANISNLNTFCNTFVGGYIYYCNKYVGTQPGQVITCSVLIGQQYAQGIALFIDWNLDNVFSLPAEMVAATPGPAVAGTWSTFTFTVPVAQASGLYRLRVRCSRGVNGTSINPCTVYTYGENEDYNLYVGIPAPGPTTVSANPVQICSPGSSTLTAIGTGPFSWSNGGSGSVTVISPTVSGNFFVSVLSGSCVAVNGISITVNPTPTVSAVTSNSFLCNGNQATLTANGATNYTWIPGGPGTSIAITPTATSTYTVSGSNGTCTALAILTQSVSSIVQASSNTSVLCSGNSATLSASGAANYTWTPGGPGASFTIAPNVTSSYTLTGNTGPCTSSVSITQSVSPTPTILATTNTSILCNGSSATLTASGAANYTWNPGGTGATNIVSPVNTTTYIVSGSNGPCTSSASITQSVSNCIGFKENAFSKEDIIVFPNPFKDVITIKVSSKTEIKLFNSLSEVVLQKNISSEENINTEFLGKGIYYLSYCSGEKNKVVKVVKN